MESDSWSDAYIPLNTISSSKQKKNIKQDRLNFILKILKIYKKIQKPEKLAEYNYTHEYNLMRSIDQLHPILRYKIMKKYKICGRIVIFINQSSEEYFIQSLTLKVIENKNLKGKGIVLAIDTLGNVEDLTFQYSTQIFLYSVFKKIFHKLSEKNILRENICWREFEKLDENLLNKFPKSKKVFGNHPKYVLESLLPKNKIIMTTEFVGTFKGEKVFLRKFVKKIYNENKLKYLDLKPKGKLFAKQIDGEKFYLEGHCEKIERPDYDLNDLQSDFLNFDHEIPKNYVFKGYPSKKICSILSIEFKEVVFKRESGILIHLNKEKLYERALSEFFALNKINSMAFESFIVIKQWNKLKKYYETYMKIKKRLRDD